MHQLIAKSRGGGSISFAIILAPSIGTAQITELIDSTGDGAGNTLNTPVRVAMDRSVT